MGVAAAGDDLEEEHAVAEDVGFGREDAVQCVLRRHVSAASTGTRYLSEDSEEEVSEYLLGSSNSARVCYAGFHVK